MKNQSLALYPKFDNLIINKSIKSINLKLMLLLLNSEHLVFVLLVLSFGFFSKKRITIFLICLFEFISWIIYLNTVRAFSQQHSQSRNKKSAARVNSKFRRAPDSFTRRRKCPEFLILRFSSAPRPFIFFFCPSAQLAAFASTKRMTPSFVKVRQYYF